MCISIGCMHAIPFEALSSASPRSLVMGTHIAQARRIADEDTDIVVLRRELPAPVRAEATRLCDFGPVFRFRHGFAVSELDERGAQGLFASMVDGALRDQLRRDVVALAREWAGLTGRRHAQATLSLVDTDECRKLHYDYVDLRVVCTYQGPGTWLAPEAALDRTALGRGDDADHANGRICPDPARLVQAGAGDIVFMKGKSWGPGARGAIHRSPSIEGTGIRRLVLKVDGMKCPC
ncbi:MAG: hypothetical protein CMN30_28350 [Sandaracinus sp.]|nr:hypothetical protein [Sandaracinus sp.]|tara:strand:- start:349 stop:1056 length:708 start_codon:yes stop_codon:yes gene_type:complete